MYKWIEVVAPYFDTYDKKTCTVVDSTIETWSHRTTVELPKVQVDVKDDARYATARETWAYRYGSRDHSASDAVDYDPDVAGWLAPFTVGKQVDGWQKKSNPKVVKLALGQFSRLSAWQSSVQFVCSSFTSE